MTIDSTVGLRLASGSMLLADKVALITGGAAGQGRAAAVLFAGHGARIVVADLNDEGAGETVRSIEQAGGEALAVSADVARPSDNDRMVEAAIERFGRLDILYNNAAIQMSGRLVDCSEEEWDLTIATNLSAIFWACRAAVPRMLAGDGGSIVNTASVLGLIGSEDFAAYGAAKAGLVALASLIVEGALERHPGMRVAIFESGSAWLPYWLTRLDQHREWMIDSECAGLAIEPSAYFARQCVICFDPEDRLVGRTVSHIGADHVLWASDFPHPDAAFPNAVDEFLAAAESGLGGTDLDAVLWDTSARFYGLEDRFAGRGR